MAARRLLLLAEDETIKYHFLRSASCCTKMIAINDATGPKLSFLTGSTLAAIRAECSSQPCQPSRRDRHFHHNYRRYADRLVAGTAARQSVDRGLCALRRR